jgi:hypothetical protein
MYRLGVPLTVAAVLLLLLATPAMGATAHMTQESTTMTGADAAAGILKDVERIDLGSSVTTVTLEREGASHPVVIDYSDVMSAKGPDGTTNPVMPLLTLSVGAVALRSVIRLIQTVARFKRR